MPNKKDKSKAVMAWLKRYSPFIDYVKFNAINERPGEVAINSMYQENPIETYQDGSERKNYQFQAMAMFDYSSGNDSVNLASQEKMQNFAEWINEQGRLENYPDFGAGCMVIGARSLYNMPQLDSVNNSGVAAYVFEAEITYIESRS